MTCPQCQHPNGKHYWNCPSVTNRRTRRVQIKREPARTSFDRVFPGMPPALKLST